MQIITVSSWWFSRQLSLLNEIGCTLAILGVTLFNVSNITERNDTEREHTAVMEYSRIIVEDEFGLDSDDSPTLHSADGDADHKPSRHSRPSVSVSATRSASASFLKSAKLVTVSPWRQPYTTATGHPSAGLSHQICDISSPRPSTTSSHAQQQQQQCQQLQQQQQQQQALKAGEFESIGPVRQLPDMSIHRLEKPKGELGSEAVHPASAPS